MAPSIRLFILLAVMGAISFVMGIIVCEGRHKWSGNIDDVPFCKESLEISPEGGGL